MANLFGSLGNITPEKPSRRKTPAPKKKKSGKGGGGGSRKSPARKKGPKKFRKTRLLIKILAGLGAIGIIFGFLLVVIYGHDLPDIDKLYDDKLQQSISILDYKGNTIATYGDYFTQFVQYRDLPQNLVNAVTATEDRRFFTHWGIDPRGLARALFTNIVRGHASQGGSTITQQLAKIVFLKPERKLKRKIQEAMLAIWLERKFTKEQILTMYLNRVYLGNGANGVDAAAHKYFNKSAKHLNLYESAMIAGLLKAPTTYSPINNPHLSAERTEQVLLNMVDNGKITEDQMKSALRSGTKVKIAEVNPSAKYYADYVIEQIPELLGGKTSENIIVKTTFRPDLQALAEQTISKNMLEFSEKNNAHQASMVIMKPNGAVLAIIGGVDYAESQYNRATQAQRQPGSLFKLFVYTAAMMYGKAPDSIVNDEPFSIGSWHPANYDNKVHGQVSLREAFAHSYNLAAATLAQEIGTDNVVFMAKKMGIKSPLANVPSIALGSSEVTLLEMTTAFAHIANNGVSVQPYAVEQIKTQTGRVLYQYQDAQREQVVDVESVHKMNDLLKSVVTGGTARSAAIGRDVGGKTGTSQDFHDAWFVGFTPQLIAGVWVGNDDNAKMKKVTGGSMPARIWAQVMKPALSGAPALAIDSSYGNWGGSTGESTGVVEGFWNSLTGDSNPQPATSGMLNRPNNGRRSPAEQVQPSIQPGWGTPNSNEEGE